MPRFFRYFSRDDAKEYSGNEYYAVSNSLDSDNLHPFGRIGVTETPGYMGPLWSDSDPGISDPARHLSQLTGVHPDAIRYIRTNDENDNVRRSLRDAMGYGKPEDVQSAVQHINNHPIVSSGRLFVDEPSSLEVESAYFDKNAANLFPLTMSIIKNDYPNHRLVSSGNLSPHSSHIVKNAMERGLVEPPDSNPEAESVNDLSFEKKRIGPNNRVFTSTEEVTAQDVHKARKGLRRMLQESRIPKLSPQFSRGEMHDQVRENTQSFKIPESWNSEYKPKLPGLENY